jgi:DMSO/TMAO reductase YedYZ molybdopterin-dependent catalytic subunit
MTAATLRVSGHVDHPLRVTMAELSTMPSVVDDAATVAEGASGRAVRIAEVIEAAAPTASATHCTVVGDAGAYRASIPLATLLTGGWLAFALDGKALPGDRGGPFRLTVAAGDTLCWNVKRVEELKLTDGPEEDDVPANPPH